MSEEKQKTKQPNCLNCGHPFAGKEKFCPYCGQKNRNKNINFGDFIRDVFAGFFSWDAKFWKTLFPLLTKPGKISKDYIDGKRAKYTNPFRFYLTTSILFFLLLGAKKNYQNYKKFSSKENTTEKLTIQKNRASRDSINNYIYNQLERTEAFKDSLESTDENPVKLKTNLDDIEISFTNSDNIVSFVNFNKKYPNVPIDDALDSLKVEKSFVNRFWYSRSKTINSFISSEEEGKKFNNHLISYFSIAILILLPVLALFLKIIYIRRKINYIEHLIFSFHTQTLAFIILSVLTLISIFTPLEFTLISRIFIIVFLVYLYIAMLKFYNQKWFKTLLKFLMINILFIFLFMFTLSILSVISLALY